MEDSILEGILISNKRITKVESEASSHVALRSGIQTRSEGQSIEQPVLSIVSPIDLTQHTLLAAKELYNSILCKGVRCQ